MWSLMRGRLYRLARRLSLGAHIRYLDLWVCYLWRRSLSRLGGSALGGAIPEQAAALGLHADMATAKRMAVASWFPLDLANGAAAPGAAHERCGGKTGSRHHARDLDSAPAERRLRSLGLQSMWRVDGGQATENPQHAPSSPPTRRLPHSIRARHDPTPRHPAARADRDPSRATSIGGRDAGPYRLIRNAHALYRCRQHVAGGLRTGIQRVVRSLAMSSPAAIQARPVSSPTTWARTAISPCPTLS